MDGTIHVLDQGYVKPILFWGDEKLVIESARMSTGGGFNGWDEDKGLLSYLYKHRHECYHPSMEVLTKDGWKAWGACGTHETFIVPNTTTHTLQEEYLPVVTYPFKGQMYTFKNQRMSYSVTPNHRMYFKPKNGNDKGVWGTYKVQNQSNWGHYEPISEYHTDFSIPSDIGILVGMYLGDGFKYSARRCGFRFKKTRKIDTLLGCLSRLRIDYKSSVDVTGVTTIRFEPPETMCTFLDIEATVCDKALYGLDHTIADLRGILFGLQNTDGSVKSDRKSQITFTSTSKKLIEQYEGIAARLGYLTTRSVGSKGISVVNTYDNTTRTTLECRKDYRNREDYTGNVHCTTTSTGMLVVRGSPTDAAFICGNTPFEFVGATFEVKAPIFVFREWHRHRTQSYNEASARYIPFQDEKFIPDTERVWRGIREAGKNKQAGSHTDHKLTPCELDTWLALVVEAYETAQGAYEYAVNHGVPKELARITMPVSQYTTMRVNTNLRNWLGFLSLRQPANAQEEIRVYADAIASLLEKPFANTMGLYYNKNQ